MEILVHMRWLPEQARTNLGGVLTGPEGGRPWWSDQPQGPHTIVHGPGGEASQQDEAGTRRKEQVSQRVAEETGALSMETRISRGPRGSIQIVPRPLVLDDR